MNDLIQQFNPPRQLIDHVENQSDSLVRRLRIHFKNGCQLSIVRGMYTIGVEQGLFEIAAFNQEGKMDDSLFDEIDQGGDVLGYCDLNKVSYYIDKISLL